MRVISEHSMFWTIYLLVIAAGVAFFIWFSRTPRVSLPVPQDSRKYCRDCQWCVLRPNIWHRRRDLEFARCAHITSICEPAEVLVRGSITEDNMQFCSIVRKAPYQVNAMTRELFLPAPEEPNGMSLCGPQGRYWEQR